MNGSRRIEMENEWGSVTVSELSCDTEDPFGRRALTRSWGLFAEGRGKIKRKNIVEKLE